jgi:uncharacterized protein YjbI with pentapeptide repeats
MPTERTNGAPAEGWRLLNFERLKKPPEWFAATVYALTMIVCASALLIGLAAFYLFGYMMFTGDNKDRIEAAKVFFPVLLALIGGPVLIWRALTAHWSAQAAQHQAEIAQEGLFTSLFTKAVEQIGATRDEIDGEGNTITVPNLEVRVGAILALERIALDSERDHWPIMEFLSAYIRNPKNSGEPRLPPEFVRPRSAQYQSWSLSVPPPRVDIQTAFSVIGRRPTRRILYEAKHGLRLDFTRANLQRINAREGNFARALFRGAYCDHASFAEADISGAWFNGTRVNDASFHFARAREALFNGAQCDAAWFFDADLERAQFARASIKYASFSKSRLADAIFFDAKLSETRFQDAKLERASFRDADVMKAFLLGVDLSQVKDITFQQINSAFGDDSARLPAGIERPKEWEKHYGSSENIERFIRSILKI